MYRLHKKILATILFLGLSSLGYSFDIGVGARIGGDISLSEYWPGNGIAYLRFTETALSPGSYISGRDLGLGWGMGIGVIMGIYTDIRFFKWLSLSPSMNIAFGRKAKDQYTIAHDYGSGKTGVELELEMKHTSIEFDLIPKFHLGWWYVGIGPGLIINLAPKMSGTVAGFVNGAEKARESVQGSDYSEKGRATTGVNVVFDTGLYIPIGSSRHNITVGLRAALNVTAIASMSDWVYAYHSDLGTDNIFPDNGDQPYGHTVLSAGLTIGYLYRFK